MAPKDDQDDDGEMISMGWVAHGSRRAPPRARRCRRSGGMTSYCLVNVTRANGLSSPSRSESIVQSQVSASRL